MSSFVKLKDVAELTVGFVGTMAEHYEESGVPFLRSLNIKPFEIDDSDMKYISENFSNSIKKSILRKDDVVIVRTGIPGTCCVIPDQYEGCNCSDVVIVRPNKEKINPLYLATYINVWGQKQILNNKVGAIQQHFNVQSAKEMLIPVVSLDIQCKIANIVESINSLIGCNRSVNDNLSYSSMVA